MSWNLISVIFLYKEKKKCRCTSPSTAMPPNFIHFHQKIDIKSVLESCDHLRIALFTGLST